MLNLEQALKTLYPNQYLKALNEIESLIKMSSHHQKKTKFCDQNDVMVITYGDSIIKKGEKPLETLKTFFDTYVYPKINSIHILPMFPYSSDDGFSVIDYEKVNQDLGDWDDIKALSSHYDLMFDAVINHISMESNWFKGYQNGDKQFDDYFITCDPNLDYSKTIRPTVYQRNHKRPSMFSL